MPSQDWLLFTAIVAMVAVVAYRLGARRHDVARGAPLAIAAVGETSSLETDDRFANDEASSDEAEGGASAAAGDPPATAPTDDPPVIPRLFDSEDDGADVTRFGSTSVSPPRTVLQVPVILTDDEGGGEEEPAGSEPYFLVTATGQTDRGQRRKQNEDSLLVDHERNLFVVADGMGGHNGGEHASKLAVKSIEDAFASGTFEGPPHEEIPGDASELARAMQMANAAIHEAAKASKKLDGMGTTLCAARFSPMKRRMFIGHVGDSRCYRLRDGTFEQLTADHTMAQLGMKGPESENLSRAVGIWPVVPIDVIIAAPAPSDLYLLCSDGLTKMLDDGRIAHVLRSEKDTQAAVDRLILFANDKGGKDNITVILIRVVAPSAEITARAP